MTTTQTPDPYPAAPAAAQGGGVGVTSLVIGLLLLLLGVVHSIVVLFLPNIAQQYGMSAVEIANIIAVMNLSTVVLAIPGVITGIIGIQPAKARGRLAAAAGLALSGGNIVSVLAVFAASAVAAAF